MGFAINKHPRSVYRRARPAWAIGNIMRRLDTFGQDVPAFNLRGENRINTVCGGVITTIIFTIVLIYCSVKGLDFYDKRNPQISQLITKEHFGQDDKVNLSENNIQFAFSVEGYSDQESKIDSRYVKYLVRTFGYRGGEKFEEVLSYHKCDEKDYEKFYPVKLSDKPKVTAIINDENRGLYCVDPLGAELVIFGDYGLPDHKLLEIILVPCNYVHTVDGYTEDFIADECIADLEQQRAHLGPINFQLYINDSTFNP